MATISPRFTISSSLNPIYIYIQCFVNTLLGCAQEARSKFVVDVEPEDAVTVDPLEGVLGPEGSTVLHYRQSSTSASIGKISCKVYISISLVYLKLVCFIMGCVFLQYKTSGFNYF